LDNNCVGGVDEAGALDADDWYIDGDGDGYGAVGVSISACDQPQGYADNFADCDDNDNANAPNLAEACDSQDNDCDSDVDEDFDQDSDGALDENDAGCAGTYAASVLDCDDSDDDTQPGGTEVCGDGIDQNCDGSDLICFNEVVFSNCTKTGRSGPSQTQCNSAYAGTDLSGAVTVNAGIQQWVVPQTNTFTIEVLGARGGGPGATSGKGARMSGDFNLTLGDVLHILVGQQGGDNSQNNGNCDSSGGGGTFVVRSGNPLIIAGGGGADSNLGNGYDATTATNGVGTCSGSNTGGTGGNGGGTCSGSGAGGGGFTGNGADSGWGSAVKGGDTYINGGLGAPANQDGLSYAGEGGFGGGAAGHGNCWIGGGSGGGYSGGGASASGEGGGGGGSFNSGTGQSNTAGVNSGHGLVTISLAN
jgi:hypothetical protein